MSKDFVSGDSKRLGFRRRSPREPEIASKGAPAPARSKKISMSRTVRYGITQLVHYTLLAFNQSFNQSRTPEVRLLKAAPALRNPSIKYSSALASAIGQ